MLSSFRRFKHLKDRRSKELPACSMNRSNMDMTSRNSADQFDVRRETDVHEPQLQVQLEYLDLRPVPLSLSAESEIVPRHRSNELFSAPRLQGQTLRDPSTLPAAECTYRIIDRPDLVWQKRFLAPKAFLIFGGDPASLNEPKLYEPYFPKLCRSISHPARNRHACARAADQTQMF